jgi:hypothetical protein
MESITGIWYALYNAKFSLFEEVHILWIEENGLALFDTNNLASGKLLQIWTSLYYGQSSIWLNSPHQYR